MDDLFPFLVFIVIALVNLVKFVLDKNAKNKPASPTQKPGKAPSSTLEDFFEKLSGKLEPEPIPLPDWPEDDGQADSFAEQEVYEAVPEPAAEIISMPVVETPTVPREEVQTASLKSAMAAMPALSSGFASLRMPSSQMKSNNVGSINYSLRNKKELRKAIIANVVFSTPRACDPSFDNTVSK